MVANDETVSPFLNWRYVEHGQYFLERAATQRAEPERSFEVEAQLERDAMIYFLKSLPKDGASDDTETYALRRLMQDWLKLPSETDQIQAAVGPLVPLRRPKLEEAPGAAWSYTLGYWFGHGLVLYLYMVLIVLVNFAQMVVWIPEQSAFFWLSRFGSVYRSVGPRFFAFFALNDCGLGENLGREAHSIVQDVANGFRDGVKQQPRRTASDAALTSQPITRGCRAL